jgi:predicted GIY-YIG superfamily endonuclease
MRDYNGIINISEPEDDYSIYIMYSSDNTDKSIYIGLTKNTKQRVYYHSIDRKRKENINKPLYIWLNNTIDEAKKNIIFEVIEEQLSENDAFTKEIQYVNEYKSKGYFVLNITNGGKGNNKQRTSTTKQLLSLRNKERTEKGWKSPNRKKVYKYNIDNVLLSEYACVTEAALKENVSPSSVGEWCRKDKQPRNNFIWSYVKLN